MGGPEPKSGGEVVHDFDSIFGGIEATYNML